MHDHDKLVLQRLGTGDANFLFELYSNTVVAEALGMTPFLSQESPIQFVERIIASCNCIFTIRLMRAPQIIIGECALHDFDLQSGEIEIGGSLLPAYWGRGIMSSAFELLASIAKRDFEATTLIGRTNTSNESAIKMAKKLGFEVHTVDGMDTIMRKSL